MRFFNRDRIVNFIGGIMFAAIILCFALQGLADAKVVRAKNDEITNVINKAIPILYEKESSSGKNKNDGDNGKAIGPFQIWEIYWQDAVNCDKSIGGNYQDCRKYEYAEKIVKAYLRCYINKENPTIKDACYLHNAGPGRGKHSIKAKQRVADYWRDCQRIMKEKNIN